MSATDVMWAAPLVDCGGVPSAGVPHTDVDTGRQLGQQFGI